MIFCEPLGTNGGCTREIFFRLFLHKAAEMPPSCLEPPAVCFLVELLELCDLLGVQVEFFISGAVLLHHASFVLK